MAWTYSGDPADSNLDAVRFHIGDTDKDDQQFSNAEIEYLIAQNGSVYGAAVEACRQLIAKYSRQVNKTVGDLKISYSDRVKNYQAVLSELRKQQALRTAGVVAGGSSQSRKDTVEQDSDRVKPSFSRNQFDHPGTDQNANHGDDYSST